VNSRARLIVVLIVVTTACGSSGNLESYESVDDITSVMFEEGFTCEAQPVATADDPGIVGYADCESGIDSMSAIIFDSEDSRIRTIAEVFGISCLVFESERQNATGLSSENLAYVHGPSWTVFSGDIETMSALADPLGGAPVEVDCQAFVAAVAAAPGFSLEGLPTDELQVLLGE
jgi:hypothetical protein